eukprot:gene3115-13126_t
MSHLLSASSFISTGSLGGAGSLNFKLPCVAASPRTSASGIRSPVICTTDYLDDRTGAPRSECHAEKKHNNNRNQRSAPVTHAIAPPSFAPSFPSRTSSPPLPSRRRTLLAPRTRNVMVEAMDMDHLEDIQARAREASKWTCVVYYANWCRNCRDTMPELLGLCTCDDLAGKVQFVKANIQEGSHAYQMAISKDVQGLPFACVSRPNGEYAVGISAKDVDGLKSKLELIFQNPYAVHFAVLDDGDMDVFN